MLLRQVTQYSVLNIYSICSKNFKCSNSEFQENSKICFLHTGIDLSCEQMTA